MFEEPSLTLVVVRGKMYSCGKLGKGELLALFVHFS